MTPEYFISSTDDRVHPPREATWLSRYWAALGWRRLAMTVGISALLSTQLLFQENLFAFFALAEVFESLGLYFIDILLIALLLIAFVGAIDLLSSKSVRARLLALPLSLIAAVAGGMGLQMLLHFGDGPYPPQSFILAEAARWLLAGGAILVIYETARRQRMQLHDLQSAEVRREILSNQMMEARLKMMEAQIEPHFLFNTLATLKRLYRTEPVGGARMLSRLKAYLEAALPKMRDGTPSLGEELELVRAYLEILQIRMGTRLSFGIELPPTLAHLPFPCMVLITLVENAIKHGLNPQPDGGRIDIRVIDAGPRLLVEVSDDGVGFQVGAGTSGTGIGLANIRARLAALFGRDAALTLLAGENAGVVARVDVPKRTLVISTNAHADAQ